MQKPLRKRKTREHGFYVVNDLRTDVFMAYERALYIPGPRAVALLLGFNDRSVTSLLLESIMRKVS